MESREQRITTLATTLKSSGIAKSDSQARMMAEDMIGVEEHVQRDYEVEHARAHEYLQTAKNLGTPRQIIKPESKVEIKTEVKDESRGEPKQDSSRKIEELYTSKIYSSKKEQPSKQGSNVEYTNMNFAGKILNQSSNHDTHNSALEAIKSQVVAQNINPNEDIKIVDNTIIDNVDEIKTVEEKSEEPKSSIVLEPIIKSSIEQTTEPAIEPTIEPISEPIVSAKLDEIRLPEASSDSSSIDIPEDKLKDSSLAEHEELRLSEKSKLPEEPKLNAQKLIDIMEEDGKLEEHTREIKEKPKDVKPKEAYEENNIDLSSVFSFNKK